MNFWWLLIGPKLVPPNQNNQKKSSAETSESKRGKLGRRQGGGRRGGKPPLARRFRWIRGSERKEVRGIKKKRIGKKRDWKNAGRSTRRPDGSADYILYYMSGLIYWVISFWTIGGGPADDPNGPIVDNVDSVDNMDNIDNVDNVDERQRRRR